MTTRERHRTCDTDTDCEHLATVTCILSTVSLYCMNECLLWFFCINCVK